MNSNKKAILSVNDCQDNAHRIVLVPDMTITPGNDELVTFGIPFPPGKLTTTDELVFQNGNGKELPVYIEETFQWQGSKHPNSIRSILVQLSLDMSNGKQAVCYSINKSSVRRVKKQAIENGFIKAGETKAGLPHPRIFAAHDPIDLAKSQLIPPYQPGIIGDKFEKFSAPYFDKDEGTPFDYSTSTQANWLFDKATAHYKKYMDLGEIKYLKEAFLAFRYYMTQIKFSGGIGANCKTQGRGAWVGDCSDNKYVYPEPIKIHIALTGDDSWLPENDSVQKIMQDMSEQVEVTQKIGGGQITDLYDSEKENWTERTAGIALINHVQSCSLYASKSSCERVELIIDSLVDHQQVAKSWDTENGWLPMPGFFRHSWSKHEGNEYPGSGSKDDRRGSPWMSENIADGLWQAYWQLDESLINNHDKISEVLRRLANALARYGFSVTWDKKAPNYKIFVNNNQTTSGCIGNTAAATLYSMSDIASQQSLYKTQTSDGYYSDSHNVEMFLPLSAGLYFETNATNRSHILGIINDLETNTIIGCRNDRVIAAGGPPRKWNWQHRSNGFRTWKWVEKNNN